MLAASQATLERHSSPSKQHLDCWEAFIDMNSQIRNYLRKDINSVEGYISVLDAHVFGELVTAQSGMSISGSLAEIGVHCGKSFFILHLGRAEGEKAIAIDLFEDDNLYTGRQGIDRGRRFVRNFTRLKFDVGDEEMWKGSSHDITAEALRERAAPIRFFSIDGGHRYDDVVNDLDLAAGSLHEKGVIAADDFSNFLWPEVGAAVCDWLRANPGFRAFAITPVKLYICRSEAAAMYRTLIEEIGGRLESNVGEIDLFGSTAWGLESPLKVRVASAIRRRVARIVER